MHMTGNGGLVKGKAVRTERNGFQDSGEGGIHTNFYT
jgi:hypothetical protein